MSLVGIFATNSAESSISLYEYLSGLMPSPIVGGSEQTTPDHARVIMLGFPSESTQVTRTTGQGNRAAHGFFFNFMAERCVVPILDLCVRTKDPDDDTTLP